MTICIECAAAVARDRITGEECPVAADATFLCSHPDAGVDPVTGQLRGDLPSCREINMGACPFFVAIGTSFVRRRLPQRDLPRDAFPIDVRLADASKR